ncbi:glycerophosphoryl diester phosphodiesterase membrane domain-containing protein [Actinocorallia populi]|uniref:glycerophosphoryl diester phosphodiesterase membrane domain-containing protein n=1 Tax=Actinocorallia populi TaxID=2079200 RepID=UPI000D08F3D1|nr:glycerophosphoryl diester phosphodiesterase membrane domain-containing protein [Actinocorallia populi]
MRVDRAELLGGEIPLRPLSVAETLDAALAVLRRSPRAVLGPAAAMVAVLQVLVTVTGYFFVGGTDEYTPGFLLRSVGEQATLAAFSGLASALVVLVLAGLLAPVIARSFFGQPVSLRGVWRDARPRLPGLAAVAAALGLGVPLLGALPLAPFVAVAGTGGSVGLAVLLGLLGLASALALGVWLYTRYVLAAPAVVLERQGARAAFSASARLVGGQWWKTFGVLVLTTVLTTFMGLILQVPFLAGGLLFFGADPQGWQAVAALAAETLGQIASWTVTAPFEAAVIALLYLDRRNRREGLDLELQQRAEVPDEDFPALWARP